LPAVFDPQQRQRAPAVSRLGLRLPQAERQSSHRQVGMNRRGGGPVSGVAGMDRKKAWPPFTAAPLLPKTTTKASSQAPRWQHAASAMATPREQISSDLVEGMATAPRRPPSVHKTAPGNRSGRGLKAVAQVLKVPWAPRTKASTTTVIPRRGAALTANESRSASRGRQWA